MADAGTARADALAALQESLGVVVGPELLDQSLTHRSYAAENLGVLHNERLEFLGDMVLGLVITDELYRRHPADPESRLARMRASIVSAPALAEVARTIGLGPCLRLGRGEAAQGGADKPSILADAMEAVLAAVYLDRGPDAAAEVVLRLFAPALRRAASLGAGLDWKTSLQELSSRMGLGVPRYLITSTGPDHAKSFYAEVAFGDDVRGAGVGASKKVAELRAAEQAYLALADPGEDVEAQDIDRAAAGRSIPPTPSAGG